MAVCECEHSICGWDLYKDRCQAKFEFDENMCAQPGYDMGSCEEHLCPKFLKECAMFMMPEEPSWVCRTETIHPKTGSRVVFRDEFPGQKPLSKVIDYLIQCKVGGRDVALMEVKRKIGGLNGTHCGI